MTLSSEWKLLKLNNIYKNTNCKIYQNDDCNCSECERRWYLDIFDSTLEFRSPSAAKEFAEKYYPVFEEIEKNKQKKINEIVRDDNNAIHIR